MQQDITSLMQESTSSDTMTTAAVALGAVGGVLAAGAITAISVASVIIVLVVIKKQRKIIPFKKGCYVGLNMYNPVWHCMNFLIENAIHCMWLQNA